MKGLIITSHYTQEEAGAQVHLFGRLEDGRSFEYRCKQESYFYIRTQDVTDAKKIISAEFQDCPMQTLQHEPVTKISISQAKEIPVLRQELENRNIPCYEADIKIPRRFMIDTNLFAYVELGDQYKEGISSDVLFDNTPIKAIPAETFQPKILSFDIETTKDMKQILSLALIQEEHKEVLVVKNSALENESIPEATLVENEEELIIVFFDRLKKLDPDIITGWHVIDFDLDLLRQRTKYYDIPFTLGRTEKTAQVRKEQSFFRDSKVSCQGRIVLDGIQLLKSSFVKLEDYKLNTAAKEFLDDTKLIEEDDRFELIEESYHKDPKLFLEYNLKDADLVLRILEKSGVFELTLQRSILTGMHMDNVKASIASFDSLYLRELRKENYVAPSTRPQERDEGMGGFVMNSKPGLYTHILVLDFKSLYPSIMRTFNIDPVAYLGQTEDFSEEELKQKEKYICAPNHAVIQNTQSILPTLLTTLWKARDKAKEQGNELARYAIKILMNSMYGVLASPNSRFHNRKLSNAITSFGQFFIKLTAEELANKGYEVIYGDTDSVFVDVKTEKEEDAQQIGKEIEKNLNIFLQDYITNNYSRESILQLEFEKLFTNFFMPTVRGSSSGAKKRYAGLRRNPDNELFLDVTGLEIVRSDWTQLAKTFQEELLMRVFRNEDIQEVIRTFISDLQKGKLDELVVYKKSLRKSLSKYTKTTPPHVKAARLLDALDSNIIRYVITKDGPQPLQKITSPIDYEHYIEKQLKPIAQSLLEVMHLDFDDVRKATTQTGLGQFM